MSDYASEIPVFDPVKWEVARRRAIPAIGHLVLNWAVLDSGMTDTIYKCRMARMTDDGFDALMKPISPGFRDRLNEWIRLALPMAGQAYQGDNIRTETLRLQSIRDDIVHNVQMIWLAENGEFVIRASRGAARPIPLKIEGNIWTAADQPSHKKRRTRYTKVYTEREVWTAVDETHALFARMQAVRPAVTKCIPK
jgi:hypothetical protein